MRFLALEKLINLHDGYRKTVKIDSLEVLIVQEAGEVFVVQSRCPHQGQHLEQGLVQEGSIHCPWHHFVFDLATGVHQDGLCDALATYAPIFDGNVLGIMIND